MFFLNNDVPLTLARAAMVAFCESRIENRETLGGLDRFFEDHNAFVAANRLTWDLCRVSKRKYTILPGGRDINISNEMFVNRYDQMAANEHVTLYIGTVGSGWGDRYDDYENSSEPDEIVTGSQFWRQVTYGPFLDCPVIISQQDFEQYRANLYREIGIQPPAAIDIAPDGRQLGRPKKADGAIELVVRNEFMLRLKAGRLINDKKEAILADAIQWVQERFEDEVKRATMQRYLKPVFEAMSAQN